MNRSPPNPDRRLTISILLWGLCLSLLATAASAHPDPELGRPWVESWTVEDFPGNSHQAWDLRLDDLDRVWVGNGSGALYFDGSRWRLAEAPTGTRVDSPLPSADGRVYLGTTSDLGYLEANARAEWRYVSLVQDVEEVPQFGTVQDIEATADGIFYLTSRFLFRFVPATGDLRWIPAAERFLSMASAGGLLYVADAGAGIQTFWAEPDRLQPAVRWSDLPGAFEFMARRPDDRLVVLSSAGFFELVEGTTLRRWPTEIDAWFPPAEATGAETLDDGSFVVNSRLDGLMVLGEDGELRRHLSTDQGLRWPWVNSAVLDRQGGLWIAHDGGISRAEIHSPFSYFGRELGGESVEALTRHRGRLFAATMTGLKVLDPAADASGQASFSPATDGSLETWSLLDTGEQLLVGDSGGVSVVQILDDGRTASRRIYESRRAVRLALSPRDPDLAFAALEDGVLELRRSAGTWHSAGKLEGYDLPVIYVEQAMDGALWFGTTTGKYHRVASIEGWPHAEIETFGAEAGVPRGNAHLFRAGGELLFGTWSGFRRFDGTRFLEDPSFPEPLINPVRDIHRLAEGPDGRLWIRAGSAAGVAERGTDGTFTWDLDPLRKLSNIKISAIHVDPDGVVWFGRRDGVVRFDAPAWKPPPALPPVRVQRVTVPGEADPFFGGALPSEQWPTLVLAPETDALRIEYAVADYGAPRALEFRTLLEGVDRDWTPWNSEAHRDFTSLPPGRRSFRVEARNSLGQVAESEKFQLARKPPWFQSWVAYAAYALALFAFLMLAAGWTARRRTRRLEAERVRLSRLVEERTVELKHQTEQLAAEQEAKNRFFANVSHELRTPLTLTLGPLEDAASGRQGQLPAGAARAVDMALRNARHLRNLIDQVLDVGRLEAGRMPISAQEGDLGSFVQRIAERFAPAAKRAGKVLDLEGVEGGVEVFFDPTHFERIVSNLLSNAFKFTPPGGRISVRVFRREDPLQIRAVLEVKDSGAGIAAHDLPRVFDRYFQASRTVADQPGTGIGLALVKELVELHGGTVSAESEAGRGATFRLDLRLGRSHFDDEEVEPGLAVTQREDEKAEEAEEADFYVQAETEATEMHQANLESDDTTTLLIVDDNAELRGFLRQRFSALYRILEASEGGAALELCRRRLPDLVIADVMMPGMDGLELTRRLKADRDLEFVPVILLTSRSATEDAVSGLGEGADDYLRKPFESDELQARIDRLISSRRQLRARFAAPEAVTGLNGNDADFDRRLLAAIENQIEAGELSVKSLADSMAMDRTHLYRRVQALRGVTPQDLIRKAKLQTAARMLAGREGTVTEVAYSVGFKSLGHFSDSFRRHFGVPPSRWAEEAAVDTSPPA